MVASYFCGNNFLDLRSSEVVDGDYHMADNWGSRNREAKDKPVDDFHPKYREDDFQTQHEPYYPNQKEPVLLFFVASSLWTHLHGLHLVLMVFAWLVANGSRCKVAHVVGSCLDGNILDTMDRRAKGFVHHCVEHLDQAGSILFY